tara:strand:+ start:179 stop:496 length:318 start_codon:yes stop_codon:yes gene_type:complete
MKIYFIYVTFGSLKEAKSLGNKLVKNKLAACTNIIPTIYSTYVWKNKTMTDKECSMIIKTSKSKVKAAIKFIVGKHSYQCPAVSAFPIKFAHSDFKRWINEQTTS